MTKSLVRTVVSIALLSGLMACGFQPRAALKLPADVGPVMVVSKDPNSRLADALERRLVAAGMDVKDAEVGTAVNPDPRKPVDLSGVGVLDLVQERWGDLPISLDSLGRAQELSLRYAVVFEVRDPDGTIVVPQQTIELARDYVASPTNSIGTEGEREILVKEMQREMVNSILLRIDTVVRKRLKEGLPVGGTPQAPSTTP